MDQGPGKGLNASNAAVVSLMNSHSKNSSSFGEWEATNAFVLSIVAAALIVVFLLAFLLILKDPESASRAMSFAASLTSLFAAIVTFRVLALRGVTLDPLIGTAMPLAVAGFSLASLSWLLDALRVKLLLGSFTIGKLSWYLSSLIIVTFLYELGRAARALAGLKKWEVTLAFAVFAALSTLLYFLTMQAGFPQWRAVEGLITLSLLTISILAFLPVYRGRLSRGIALASGGGAFFFGTAFLASAAEVEPVANALYALSFLAMAAGLSLYGEENPPLR